MDSQKDSTPMKDSMKPECDGENEWSCKNSPVISPVQESANDNSENVFTSSTNQMSAFTPLNGPVVRCPNTTPSSEPNLQSNMANENSSDTCKMVCGPSQSQIRNKGNNLKIEHVEPVAGSSKAPPNDKNPESTPEPPPCQRYKVCLDKTGISCAAPSTSGVTKACDSSESNCRENRKRPSSLKLSRPDLDADDSSSDTGNDDYSLGSEDGCIYTYRGGEHLADLPSSFFSLDMGLPLDMHMMMMPNAQVPQQGAGVVRDQDSRASSPDMDFLEMDFDPGPSCEVDTGDESTPDAELEVASNMPEENEPVVRGTSPEYMEGARYNPVDLPTTSTAEAYVCNMPSTSRSTAGQGDVGDGVSRHTYGPYITHVNARGEQLLVRRTMAQGPVQESNNLHISSGDLVSPREMLNYEDDNSDVHHAHQINQGEGPTLDSAHLSSSLYHISMAKKLMGEKTRSDTDNQDIAMAGDMPNQEVASCSTSGVGCAEPPRCMVWSERDACERQVTQIGTSACGATAVVNVFIALGVPVNIERINSAVGTRQRANNAPIPRYLLSRAVAGCTAADLVTGIQTASDGLVTARFFPTYPERAVSLSHWLADWISLGAVPILTLNLQVVSEGEVPDAWHHQMVFGVSSQGVYLCNPVECVRENVLWPRLASPSVLLVRTRDTLARFTPSTDLTPLMVVPDRRFHTLNVLGQVVNAIREWRSTGWTEHGTLTRHIRVPAAYQAGVTVAALTGSEAHRRLMHAPQLPILASHDPA